jgi:chemotaxis protein methyltransferase CheR
MRLVINSQFFLDPESWEFLGNEIIPSLLTRRKQLRFWSAGCYTGKEPYSLAFLFWESQPDSEVTILATDCDETALAAAKRGGPFSERDIENIPSAWRSNYLQSGGPPYFVQPDVCRKLEFVSHNLLSDSFPADFDLILYRNIETFFSAETNASIWRNFHTALRQGGLLFVGATDHMPTSINGGFERIRSNFYRRR